MSQFIDYLASGLRDNSGNLLASGTVTSYAAGTTTLLTLYQDSDLETPHSNPATLDSAGNLYAYTNQKIKLVIKNSSGSTIRTIDYLGHTEDGVAADSITGTQLAAAIAGDGLAQDGSGNLYVRVDDIGIEIASDILQLKADGVKASHIDETEDVEVNSLTIDSGGPVLTYDSSTYLKTSKPILLTDSAGTMAMRYRNAAVMDIAASNLQLNGTSGPRLGLNGSDLLHVNNSSGTLQGPVVVSDDTAPTDGFRLLYGTASGTATSVTITFAGAGYSNYVGTPNIAISPTNATMGANDWYLSTVSTSQFIITFPGGPITYSFQWISYGKYT